MLQENKLREKQLKEKQVTLVDTPNIKKIEAKSTELKEQTISAKQVATETKMEVNQKQKQITSGEKNTSTTKTEITEESESTITTTTTTTITTTVTTKKVSSSKVVSSIIEEKDIKMIEDKINPTKTIEGSENPRIKIGPLSNVKDHHEDTPTTAINEVDESLTELLKITQHHINTIRRSDAKRLRAQSVPIPMLLEEDDEEDDDEEEDNTYAFSSEEEIIQNIRQNNPSIVEGKIDNIINNIRKGKFSDDVKRRKESDSDKTVKFEDDETLKEDLSEKSDKSDCTEVVKLSNKPNVSNDELELLKDLKAKLPVDRFPESVLKRVDSKMDSLDSLDYQITIGVN